jgi:hypothetical protein
LFSFSSEFEPFSLDFFELLLLINLFESFSKDLELFPILLSWLLICKINNYFKKNKF